QQRPPHLQRRQVPSHRRQVHHPPPLSQLHVPSAPERPHHRPVRRHHSLRRSRRPRRVVQPGHVLTSHPHSRLLLALSPHHLLRRLARRFTSPYLTHCPPHTSATASGLSLACSSNTSTSVRPHGDSASVPLPSASSRCRSSSPCSSHVLASGASATASSSPT